MKKAILDVPLWERPEDCKLYVHLHRMDCFLSVIWTLVLILTMLDLFAIAEKLVSAWTFAPLFAACLFIPISLLFVPRLKGELYVKGIISVIWCVDLSIVGCFAASVKNFRKTLTSIKK